MIANTGPAPHRLAVTIFRDVSATRSEVMEWTADELAEKLRRAHAYPSKAACPLMKLARFGTKRSEKGSLRHDQNVLEVHGIEADYDAGEVSLADAQMLLYEQSINAVLYTSPSHTEKQPRWRVLCPLSRPYPPAERARFVARLNGALGGILAPESFVLSQSYYAGRVNGSPYEVAQVRGECIDLLPDLDAKAISPQKNGESRAERLGKIRSTDPVLTLLTERQMVLNPRMDGGADIICPFEAEHTTPRAPADCSYWPPNTGGFERGHFKCLHSHCAQRTDDDFLRAIGFETHAPSAEAPNSADWPAPINIMRAFRVPPFTQDDVPPVLGRYAVAFARSGGFDPSMPVLACVIGAASMIDDGLRVRVPGGTEWYESPRLWGALIGGSAAGKSPCIKAAAKPLTDLHRELVQEWERDPAPKEERPPRPALVSNDPTTEALADRLRDNERGILVLNDELEGLLGQHDAYRNKAASKDRGEYLRLYDGGPHQIDRVQRGSFFVPNWGASILTASTPVALRKLARYLPADGLLQRFLVALAVPMRAPDDSIRVEPEREAYAARLRELYSHKAETGRKFIDMDGEAKDLFCAERDQLRELVQGCESISEALASHVGKHPGMLARVALIFHALSSAEHPASRRITAATMECAIRFMHKAFRHSAGLYLDILGDGSGMDLARAVGRILLADAAAEVQKRDLIHKSRAFRAADDYARAQAMETLEAYGWVLPLKGDYDKLHPTRWAVNPRTHECFKAEADEHRARRETVKRRLRGED
jgi:hypothetical protein